MARAVPRPVHVQRQITRQQLLHGRQRAPHQAGGQRRQPQTHQLLAAVGQHSCRPPAVAAGRARSQAHHGGA
ncbi:MAG: hypothetical protein ACK559_17120, partial [bacterium]